MFAFDLNLPDGNIFLGLLDIIVEHDESLNTKALSEVYTSRDRSLERAASFVPPRVTCILIQIKLKFLTIYYLSNFYLT